MKWLALVVLLLVGCEHQSGPFVENRPVVVASNLPDSGEEKLKDDPQIVTTLTDAAVQHAAIQAEYSDVVTDLRKVAVQLESLTRGPHAPIGGGGSGTATSFSSKRKEPRPTMVKAKLSRKKVTDDQLQIQKALHDSEDLVEKLDSMSPRELRKRLRQYRNEQRRSPKPLPTRP